MQPDGYTDVIKAAAAVVALLIAATAHADVELTLRTTPREPSTIHVTLGSTWFRMEEGSDSVTYDLAARRVLRVDNAKHQMRIDSLFADVDGRERELENRLFLGKMLAAGKAEENPMAPTLAEHQLSMRKGAAAPSGIEMSTKDGERRYVWNGQELMAWSTAAVPLPAASRERFVAFFRARFGGHPQILADLQRLDGVPKWIRFADGMRDAVRIEVRDVVNKPDSAVPAPPANAKEVFDDPVMAALAAKSVTPQSRDAAIAAIVAAASAAAQAKKPLEAMLGFLEASLMGRNSLAPEFSTYKDSIVSDPDVKALFGALQSSNEAEAKAAVKTLTRLQGAAGPKGYVVGIFKANNEAPLGETEAAANDFHAALEKNPMLTGVWKDLGDIYAGQFRSPDAWRCYAMARRIMPEHNILKGVDATEARLLREHPEFF